MLVQVALWGDQFCANRLWDDLASPDAGLRPRQVRADACPATLAALSGSMTCAVLWGMYISSLRLRLLLAVRSRLYAEACSSLLLIVWYPRLNWQGA